MIPPVALGELVRLRPMEESDAKGPYLAWLHDEAVTRYLEVRFAPPTASDLREYIAAARADAGTAFYAIERGEDGTHVGTIKLGPIEAAHSRAEIGIMIGDRSVWGLGLATDAIEAVSRIAFDELGLLKLTAGCYVENAGSARAFARAGFHEEGTRRLHFRLGEAFTDLILLARFHPRHPARPPR